MQHVNLILQILNFGLMILVTLIEYQIYTDLYVCIKQSINLSKTCLFIYTKYQLKTISKSKNDYGIWNEVFVFIIVAFPY